MPVDVQPERTRRHNDVTWPPGRGSHWDVARSLRPGSPDGSDSKLHLCLALGGRAVLLCVVDHEWTRPRGSPSYFARDIDDSTQRSMTGSGTDFIFTART